MVGRAVPRRVRGGHQLEKKQKADLLAFPPLNFINDIAEKVQEFCDEDNEMKMKRRYIEVIYDQKINKETV